MPSDFTKGILIRLMKKHSLDTSVAKNYRPVLPSTVLSKYSTCYINNSYQGHMCTVDAEGAFDCIPHSEGAHGADRVCIVNR